MKHCSACHGSEGHGDGLAAEYLFPKPRAFRDSSMRFASTPSGVMQTIRNGVPRSAMPGFSGVLSNAEIAGLTRLVGEMTKGGTSSPPPATPLRFSKPPYFTEGMVGHGSSLYRSMGCVGCHGATGHGVEIDGLLDSMGKPVRPADLASGLYKSGQRPEDLYRTIITGVPGTPMPSYASLLSDDQVWALVAFITRLAPPRLAGQTSGAEFRLQSIDDALLADQSQFGWLDVDHAQVAMRPLWFRVEDTVNAGVSFVRAGDHIGIHLRWDDATCDVNQDSGRFSDGVAVMFARSDVVPPLPMGVQVEHQPTGPPVNIWHWKASRQFDASTGRRHDADEPRVLPEGNYHLFGPPPEPAAAMPTKPADGIDQDLRLDDPLYRTAVAARNIHSDPSLVSHATLEANAVGFGTLTYQPAELQDLESSAVWANGHWFVTIYHSISQPKDGDIQFLPGKRIPFTLAIWNGSKGDRDGTKLISGWHWLVIDGEKATIVPTPATPAR
ncbi:MAG: c-type cytochrome [Phycisphaerales bacterium]|nr:c-type cytochrome [Phycisphaerales bacterium]